MVIEDYKPKTKKFIANNSMVKNNLSEILNLQKKLGENSYELLEVLAEVQGVKTMDDVKIVLEAVTLLSQIKIFNNSNYIFEGLSVAKIKDIITMLNEKGISPENKIEKLSGILPVLYINGGTKRFHTDSGYRLLYPLKGIPGKLVEEPLEIVYMPEKIALEKDKLRKNSFLKKFNQFNKLIEADLYALSLINESSSAMSKSTAVEILKCLKIMIESYKELSGTDDIDKKLKFVKEKLNNNGWNSLKFNEFIIGSLLSLFTECDTDGNTVHGLIHYIHQKSYNAFMSCVEIPPVDININFNSSNISITKLKDWPGTNWILKKMINRLKKSMGRFSVSIVVCGNTFYTYIKSGAESAQVHVKFEPPSTGGVVHIEYQESDTDEFNQLRLLFFKQILEAVGMKVEVIKNQYLNALLDKNNLQNRHQATEAFLYFIGSASYGYKVEMYLSDIVKKGFHAKATEAARQLAKIYMAEGNL